MYSTALVDGKLCCLLSSSSSEVFPVIFPWAWLVTTQSLVPFFRLTFADLSTGGASSHSLLGSSLRPGESKALGRGARWLLTTKALFEKKNCIISSKPRGFLWSRGQCFSHFTGEETEAQRLRNLSSQVAEPPGGRIQSVCSSVQLHFTLLLSTYPQIWFRAYWGAWACKF